MVVRFIRYYIRTFLFLSIAFLLHQETVSLVFPHTTHVESLLLVIAIVTFLSTIILIQFRKKQDRLNEEKNRLFDDLIQSDKEYKSLFDNDLTGNIITNEEGIIIDVNQSFLNIFGYETKDEICGKGRRTFYPDSSDYDFVTNELKTKGKLNNYQTVRKRKNGELIHVIENIIVTFETDGSIRTIKGYVFDITDRVTSEKLLLEKEKQFSKVINSISSAFYFYHLTGEELIFTGSNPAADKITGISHSSFVGKKIADCFPNLPSYIPEVYKKVARGDLSNQSFEIEYSEDRFSGICTTDVFKIDRDEIAVNFIDITEKKNAEKRQSLLKTILETFNRKEEWPNNIKTILSELKNFSKFDAVGIRFEKDNDYPYYVQEGFSQEFLNVENSICSRCFDGSIDFNSNGKPILECTCGMILSSDADLTKDYVSPNGSIWTNHSLDFLEIAPEDEQRINPRNTCIHHGYMSILLVPIKIGEKKVGLLQMNNKKSGKFSSSDISFYEEIGSIIGISYEKILYEQSLKEKEELFSSFMDHLHANIYIKDSDGRYIYCNKSLKNIFGSIQWNNKTAPEIMNKAEAEKIVCEDLEVMEKGFIRVEDSFMSSDGTMHDYSMQKFVIERIDKTPLIGGISFDVTERNMLIKSNIENEERWKFALEGNQDGVWDWNMETNEMFFSVQWKAMLGYDVNEISNKVDEWKKLVHPDDKQKCYNTLQSHLNGDAPYYSSIHRMFCKDGSYKWVLDRGKIIKYSIGKKPLRMIGTHTDLTQRMQMENQLTELISTKDKLFAIIGHDLRNPIGNIVNFSELLRKDCARDETSTEYIEIIKSSAERTLSLLEELLLWSRTQAGQLDFNPELLTVSSVFAEVHEILRPTAILKKIHIRNSIPKDIICYADKQMLKTILRNLIQNSIKFTNTGGLIECTAKAYDGNVQFMVSDNGVGMDSKTQKKLFKVGEYVTNFGTSGEMGSGLGLVICNEFVKKHSGSIWVESQSGKGSIFYFKLPLGENVE